MTVLTLPCLPADLHWKNAPAAWQLLTENSFSIASGPQADWFIDPAGGVAKGDAPAALFTPPDPDFTLRARVTVDFGATYDAGVLCIYAEDQAWAKLCFEYSPQGQPMIVSVVTRRTSDDCNSVVVAGSSVYLRLHRRSGAWVFHYSLDGETWRLVRYFGLEAEKGAQVGFLAQSPTGQGCRAVFSEIEYAPGIIADIRSGA
jgi:uncharacterized protein